MDAVKQRFASLPPLSRLINLSPNAFPNPRTELPATLRLLYFLILWILTVADLTLSNRLIADFGRVADPAAGRARTAILGGIEATRKAAASELVAAGVMFSIIMPVLIALPMLKYGTLVEQIQTEVVWVSVFTILFLGGAAALAPVASSPTLPVADQATLSSVLGLSFFIFSMLLCYLFALGLLLAFHSGRQTMDARTMAVRDLLGGERSQNALTGIQDDLEKSQANRTTFQTVNPPLPALQRGPDGRFNISRTQTMVSNASAERWDQDHSGQGAK